MKTTAYEINGKPCQIAEGTLNACSPAQKDDVTQGWYPVPEAEKDFRDSDAALREAEKRWWLTGRECVSMKGTPPDGFYVAQGPGVVECKKCAGHGFLGIPDEGASSVLRGSLSTCRQEAERSPVDRDERESVPCLSCNPQGHEHPVLVPLEECKEAVQGFGGPENWTNEEVRIVCFDACPHLDGIAVVRDVPCGGGHGPRKNCRYCNGTGWVKTTEFYFRQETK